MNFVLKIILGFTFFSGGFVGGNAQNTSRTVKDHFVFSAVRGTMSKPDSLILPAGTRSITWSQGDSTLFRITRTQPGKLLLVFIPPADFTGIARATLLVKGTSGEKKVECKVSGLSTAGLEGNNEAPLSVIVDALGYQTDIGWSGLAKNTLPAMQGEEIPYSLFKKAGPGNVEMIPVARYSPDFELPFGYYFTRGHMPETHELGVLSKAGEYPEHQILYPALTRGGDHFDPGDNHFGFYFSSPTHSAWSEDVWNMLFYPAHAVHASRIYALKDADGKILTHTYLVCFEEAANGDYNDYVFVVTNIDPVREEPFTNLFNGKNLDGWHSYLQGIGSKKDPDNNFRIENDMLHVIGKDLGYVITDEGFQNFHFKVDFRWGEKRWPPREEAKRDAGVCYNIPVNEPDSIWPVSIECQIQEGDVGDFWLLGFSTIMQGGYQNVPSAHTRMIKQRDAEKPYGEWNTVEILSYNGRCVHIVNGVVVNAGDNASSPGGRILLQSEYAEIYYRDVKIRKL